MFPLPFTFFSLGFENGLNLRKGERGRLCVCMCVWGCGCERERERDLEEKTRALRSIFTGNWNVKLIRQDNRGAAVV